MARHETEMHRKIGLLRNILIEAKDAWPQLDLDPEQASDSDLYISGADMIEWFIAWRQRAIDTIYATT